MTWYGVFVATAFLVGLWTASRRAPRSGIKSETILDFGPWLILGAVVGARVLYVTTFWHDQFAGKPWAELFTVWRGGLVFYGGLVGAVLTTLIFARVKKLPLWKVADVMAPSIALGYVFGRMGCLMNGCCYGRECTLPWAIHFPQGNETYPHGVHPTQIYDSLLNLAFYAGLAWLYRRKKFDGQVFGVYLVGYSVLRFVVELFRGDYPASQRYLGNWATPAQVVSLGIFAAGLVLLSLLSRCRMSRA